jgi:hypothetical protein
VRLAFERLQLVLRSWRGGFYVAENAEHEIGSQPVRSFRVSSREGSLNLIGDGAQPFRFSGSKRGCLRRNR